MKAYAVASPFGNIGDLDNFILKCFTGISSFTRKGTKDNLSLCYQEKQNESD